MTVVREGYKNLVYLNDREGGGGYTMFFENGVEMGEVLADVDGYYKWWPIFRGGYLDEAVLFAVAYTLQDLNEEWDKHVHEHFGDRHGEHDMEHGEPV